MINIELKKLCVGSGTDLIDHIALRTRHLNGSNLHLNRFGTTIFARDKNNIFKNDGYVGLLNPLSDFNVLIVIYLPIIAIVMVIFILITQIWVEQMI